MRHRALPRNRKLIHARVMAMAVASSQRRMAGFLRGAPGSSAFAEALTITLDCVLGGMIVGGLNAPQVTRFVGTPFKVTAQVSVTVPAKPPCGVMVMMYVAEFPGRIGMALLVVAEMLKLGAV